MWFDVQHEIVITSASILLVQVKVSIVFQPETALT